MQIEEALIVIEKLKSELIETQKESARKDFVIATQRALIKSLNLKINEEIKENELLNEKKRISEISKFVQKNELLDNIINEPEAIIKESKPNKKRGIKRGSKKYKNYNFAQQVTKTIYEEPEEEKCPICGAELTTVTEKTRYEVRYVPAKLEVVKIIKRSKICKKCNKKNNKIYYKVTSKPFPGSILTPSFAAWIIDHKYYLGIPFNKLEQYIKDSLNIEISKQSLATYAAKCSALLEPIFNQMKLDLLQDATKVIHIDETTLVVSKKPDEDKERKKSYVFVYRSNLYSEKQIMLYSFNETREIAKTVEWLKDFDGTIVCDDYSGYNTLKKKNNKIKLQKCMAHARRKFADILKTVRQKDRKDTKSYEILELFSQIFNLESQYKKDELNPISIVQRRKKDQIPIKIKLENLIFDVSYNPNSAIYDAVNYVKDNWDDMRTYLDNGFVEPSNNPAERAVKPFVVQRKNFQTSGSYAGARYTAKIFSIIQTARANNLNTYQYLNYIFENINNPNIKIESLLPYSDEMSQKFSNKVCGRI